MSLQRQFAFDDLDPCLHTDIAMIMHWGLLSAAGVSVARRALSTLSHEGNGVDRWAFTNLAQHSSSTENCFSYTTRFLVYFELLK